MVLLTVALWALLVEAAAETFLLGSPTRFWVVAAVVVSFAVTAFRWRKTTWKDRSVETALALLVTLALTVWLPGGLVAGFRAAGISTSTLLCMAAGGGVLLAAANMWQVKQIPLPLGLAFGALSLYGVTSFLLAALTGTPFTALFNGSSFWRLLPFALQGAVIGGLLVIPAGLVVCAIRFGLRRQQGSTAYALHQAVALAAVGLLVVASVARPERSGFRTEAASSELPQNSERMARLEKSFNAIAAGQQGSPRDRWDPDSVVQQVGRDPEALREWVRANTAWIPYRGVLRGSVGVLMDRMGNSLDRALLLARLLKAAGHEARLVHGEIPSLRAGDIVDRLVSERVALAASSDRQPRIHDSLASMSVAPDGDPIAGSLLTEAAALDSVMSALTDRARQQAGRLRAMVEPLNTEDEWSRRFDAAVTALSDHWWVQRMHEGGWLDLDLLHEESGSGPLASPTETVDPDKLPDALHHSVVIRIVAERTSAGVSSERRVLEHALRPADLIGKAMVVQFWPTEWLEREAPIQSGDDLRKRVAELRDWSAAVLIDQSVVAAGVIDDTGGPDEGGGPMSGIGQGIAGAFGALSSRPVNKVLTATWLEYEISVPGEIPQVIRRQVFDLLGPAARSAGSAVNLSPTDDQRVERSLALTMRTEVLPIVCQIAPDYVAHLLARTVTANRRLLEATTQGSVSPNATPADDLVENLQPPVSPLYSLALARLTSSTRATRLITDRPNIFTRHVYPGWSDKGPVLHDAFDIVTNDVGVGLEVRDGIGVRLEQGVFDTHIEALLRPGGLAGNAAAGFEKGEWSSVGLSGGDAGVGLDANVRARIDQVLETSRYVVAPTSPVPQGSGEFAGWWTIDPRSGTTLGFAANGWGHAGFARPLFATDLPGRAVQHNMATRAMLVFRGAALRFASVYALGFGWCTAFFAARNVVNKLEGRESLSLRAFPAASVTECDGDSIFIAMLATLPLVLLTLKMNPARSAGPPPPSEPVPDSTPAPGSGRGRAGGSPQGGRPDNPPPPEPAPPAPEPPPPPPPSKGPYQSDPLGREQIANNRSDARAMMGGRDRLIDAIDRADQAAREEYGRRTNEGANDQLAHDYSRDAWQREFNSGPNAPRRLGSPSNTKTQDLGTTQPDMGTTQPGGRPGPLYAPVRGGPPQPSPASTTLVGLGGLIKP